MSFPTSQTIQYEVFIPTPSDSDQFHQVLEVRSQILRRVITGSLNQFHSLPISHQSSLLPISLHELHDDPIVFQLHIELLLSSLDIDADACEIISEEIALNIDQITAGNREMRFRIVAVIDITQFIWTIPTNGELVVFDRGLPVRKKVEMERLGEKVGEDLGDCCICLNEFNWKEREVVKIPCGHVYDESCILKWLVKNHSCPLCRRPVPFELNDQE